MVCAGTKVWRWINSVWGGGLTSRVVVTPLGRDKRNKQAPSTTTENYGMIHLRLTLENDHVSQNSADPFHSPRQALLLPDVQNQLRQHLKKRELDQQGIEQQDQQNAIVSPRKTQRVREPSAHKISLDEEPTPTDDPKHGTKVHSESISITTQSALSDVVAPQLPIVQQSSNGGGGGRKRKNKLRRQQQKLLSHAQETQAQAQAQPQALAPVQTQSQTQSVASANIGNSNGNGTDNTNTNGNTSGDIPNKRHSTTNLSFLSGSVGKSTTINYGAITVTQVPARELQKTFAETGISPFCSCTNCANQIQFRQVYFSPLVKKKEYDKR